MMKEDVPQDYYTQEEGRVVEDDEKSKLTWGEKWQRFAFSFVAFPRRSSTQSQFSSPVADVAGVAKD
jgi:hypothetical protein